ncbi:hypothetical protein MOTE_17760 [Moorella thermoacetica]|uniref:Uncharacterized protein n=1 Tax=Neomoorella thermoacetica TaxID=1525 RepID=A0A1J5NTF3_NEOTH|nr:hypothetical protein MOTE_17760 [Moorella thermoacetica]
MIDNPEMVTAKQMDNWVHKEATDEKFIGKRSISLNKIAVKVAREIQTLNSQSAKWIASDAIRELTSEKVLARLSG